MLSPRIGRARAEQIVADAFARSARLELSAEANELLSFLKAHLVDELVAALGVHNAVAVLDEVRARTEERPHVAIIDTDTFRRSNIARAVSARGADVVALHALGEVRDLAPAPSVVVLTERDVVDDAGLPSELAFVVHVQTNVAAAIRRLESASVRVYEVVSSTSPTEIAMAVSRAIRRRAAG